MSLSVETIVAGSFSPLDTVLELLVKVPLLISVTYSFLSLPQVPLKEVISASPALTSIWAEARERMVRGLSLLL